MQQSHLIKPLLDADYPLADHGKGIFIYDSDGKDYLDACSGAVTANIGHGMKEIIDAIQKQAEKIAFVYRSQFTNEAAEKLSSLLAEKTDNHLNWTFFVNSGSEATETAIKIALQHWLEKGKPKKTKVLSRWMSYHGITLGALSMSGHSVRREKFTSLLEDWPVLEPPYCYRCPYGKEFPTCGLHCAAHLETVINRVGADQVACLIVEPVVGAAGGAITPPDGYYEKLKSICEKYEILFIADEVMTGCGRTGAMLALDHWGVKPDIAALGKGLGAGYAPIAATMVSDKVMEPIQNGTKSIMSGHTFSANPLSCATALAVLQLIDSEDLLSKVEEKANYLQKKLKKLQSEFSFIGDIRGKGLLIGMEFVKGIEAKEPFPREFIFTSKLISIAQKNGLLLYPAAAGLDGRHGDAIIIAPPLNITEDEMDELCKRLREALLELNIDNEGSRERHEQ
ncbi:aspartate aminotransferase family protein [Falsibacillus albus]|uniref:Aspartate aminotransferase family protein n=1 Tax=Falsibacillus albus TaxID=2478915 RepID=A0A3L7JY57_9BACI|nr:aspartate aminotransferase family protein [Falsibacillus albus]RLQ95194.1 aspartate aminotransferase family protein [Falsibacillus albus]